MCTILSSIGLQLTIVFIIDYSVNYLFNELIEHKKHDQQTKTQRYTNI